MPAKKKAAKKKPVAKKKPTGKKKKVRTKITGLDFFGRIVLSAAIGGGAGWLGGNVLANQIANLISKHETNSAMKQALTPAENNILNEFKKLEEDMGKSVNQEAKANKAIKEATKKAEKAYKAYSQGAANQASILAQEAATELAAASKTVEAHRIEISRLINSANYKSIIVKHQNISKQKKVSPKKVRPYSAKGGAIGLGLSAAALAALRNRRRIRK